MFCELLHKDFRKSSSKVWELEDDLVKDLSESKIPVKQRLNVFVSVT